MPVDFKESQQMKAMLIPLQEKLSKRDPKDIAQKAGITYNEETKELLIPSFGNEVTIQFPEVEFTNLEVKDDHDMWYEILLLVHLDAADGTALKNEYISLAEMPGGMARAKGFEMQWNRTFTMDFKHVTAEMLKEAGAKLNAEETQGKGDAALIFHFAPNVPILLNYYEADDEFPASGKFLIDAHTAHYIDMEATGVAIGTLLHKLVQAL